MAAPFDNINAVRKTYFINESERDAVTPANDVGKVPQLESDAKLSPRFISFGHQITAGDSLFPREVVYLSDASEGDEQTDVQPVISQSSNNSDFAATRNLTNQMAQTFIIPAAPAVDGLELDRIEITGVKVRGRRRSGDDTDAHLGAVIQGVDGSNHPDGSDLSSFQGAFTNFSDTTVTINFSIPAEVTGGTTYALVCKFFNNGGSTATDVLFRYQNTNLFANGSKLTTTDSGTTWIEQSGEDAFFEITYQYIYRRVAGYAYKASANATAIERDNILGFSYDAIVKEGNGLCQTINVLEGFTGLTIGADYYLSDTPGEISTTPGSNTVKVGRAITDTALLIMIN